MFAVCFISETLMLPGENKMQAMSVCVWVCSVHRSNTILHVCICNVFLANNSIWNVIHRIAHVAPCIKIPLIESDWKEVFYISVHYKMCSCNSSVLIFILRRKGIKSNRRKPFTDLCSWITYKTAIHNCGLFVPFSTAHKLMHMLSISKIRGFSLS